MKLIDADALKATISQYEFNAPNERYKQGGECVLNFYMPKIIDDAPTIEAEPVRHGYIVKKKRVIGRIEHHKCPECSHTWQKDKRCKIDEWLCSECGKVLAHNYTNYCPNCGAKMVGGEVNNA